ncbi:MAG: hypothetical protein U0871_26120 [Gemmataceae bacterium]
MERYIGQLTVLLGTPLGVGLVAFGAVLLLVMNQALWVRWVLVALILFTGSLYKPSEDSQVWMAVERIPLIAPLEQIQTLGRPITIVLLAIGATVAAFGSGRVRWAVPQWAYALLAVQGVLVVKMLVSGMFAYALFATLVYILTFVVFGYGAGRWAARPADVLWAIRGIGLGVALFVIANLAQITVDPTPLVAGGRFQGTTGNPQSAAMLMGPAIATLAYLATARTIPGWERVGWGLALLGTLSMLIWTSSRSGALMATFSLVILFRRRLNQFVVLAGPVAIGLAIVLSEFGEMLRTDELTRTDDTRSAVWYGLWVQFVNHPVVGAPQDAGYGRLGFAENSWLSMAAVCGLFGLVPMAIFGWLAGREVVALLRMGGTASRHGDVADLMAASLAAVFIGSLFEPSLLGVINFMVPFMTICLVLSTHLRAVQGSPTSTGRIAGPGRQFPGLTPTGRVFRS